MKCVVLYQGVVMTLYHIPSYYAVWMSNYLSLSPSLPLSQVIFADEEGQDDGGIRKEFFMLLFSQILNPDFGMFVEDEESHLIWFRESVSWALIA